MTDVTKALQSLAPGASWMLDGPEIIWEQEVYNIDDLVAKNLTWYSKDIEQPSKEQIETEIIRLQTEYQSTEYQRQRKPEYPPLADLADALYWQAQGDQSKMTAYLAAVEAVKQKYPKGDE
jgi:hypothetical protein